MDVPEYLAEAERLLENNAIENATAHALVGIFKMAVESAEPTPIPERDRALDEEVALIGEGLHPGFRLYRGTEYPEDWKAGEILDEVYALKRERGDDDG